MTTAVQMRRLRARPTYYQSMNIPGSRWLATWIAAGTAAVLLLIVAFLRTKSIVLVGTFAVLAACIALVPIVMRGIYLLLFDWIEYVPNFLKETKTDPEWWDWIEKQFARFSSSRIPAIFGMGYACFGLWAFVQGGAFQGLSPALVVTCATVTALSSFVCGVGLCAIYYMALVVWRFGKSFSIRVAEHPFGIMSTGRTLVRCYGLIALIWCLYTESGTWTIHSKEPVVALAVPAVLFFVGSFIACQFPIHQKMVAAKRAMLSELDHLLERLEPKHPEDMNEDRRKRLDFCVAEINRVRAWPEWPFHMGNLTSVAGASFATVLPELVKLALPLATGKHS